MPDLQQTTDLFPSSGEKTEMSFAAVRCVSYLTDERPVYLKKKAIFPQSKLPCV